MKNKTKGEALPRLHGQRAMMTPAETLRHGLHPEHARLGNFLDAPRLNPAVIGAYMPDAFDPELIAESAELLERILTRLSSAHTIYAVAALLALRTAERECVARPRVMKVRHVAAALQRTGEAAFRIPHVSDDVRVSWRKNEDTLQSAAVWVWLMIADAVVGDETVPGRRLTYREMWRDENRDA